MPRVSLSRLTTLNQAPTAVNFVFFEYLRAKRRQWRANKTGKLGRIGDVKDLPTPNELIGKLAERVAGAYALSSRRRGAVQQLVFADNDEAQAFIKAFNAIQSQASSRPALGGVFNVEIRLQFQIIMAAELGLM